METLAEAELLAWKSALEEFKPPLVGLASIQVDFVMDVWLHMSETFKSFSLNASMTTASLLSSLANDLVRNAVSSALSAAEHEHDEDDEEEEGAEGTTC